MVREMKSFYIGLLIFAVYGCANTLFDDFDQAGRSVVEDVYTPPISVYIFGEAMPSEFPRKCNTESCDWDSERFASADQVVAALFGNEYGTSNYFTKQLMVANRVYVNDLKIYYVKTDSNVTATTSFSAVDSSSYTLSDATGTQDKGTVNHEAGRIRIVFTGAFTCGSVSAAGCASVNNSVSIAQPEFTLVVMNINAWSLRSLSETMAHELGHYFGLSHTFSDPATDGCSTISQGTTKYIMDYSSNATDFQECEKTHSKSVLEASPFSLGSFENSPVDDNPVQLQVNGTGDNTVTGQTIKVFKGDWEGKKILGTPLDPKQPRHNVPFMP